MASGCRIPSASRGSGRRKITRCRINLVRPTRSPGLQSGHCVRSPRPKSVEHAAGHHILEEGGTPLGFHLITEGEAVVEVAGKERRRLGPGDSFGLISLIDGQPRSAAVRAITPMRTLFISPWVFRPMLDSEPEIARDLLPLLCALLRDAERHD